MKQFWLIIILTGMFTALGVWGLQQLSNVQSQQFVAQPQPETGVFDLVDVDSQLVVGSVEIETQQPRAAMTVRADLPEPIEDTAYFVQATINGEQTDLGRAKLANGNIYYTTYAQPTPIQLSDLTIHLRSTTNPAIQPLQVASLEKP